MNFTAGYISGGLAAFIITPFELSNIQMQVQNNTKKRKTKCPKQRFHYTGSIDVVSQVIRKKGIPVLWTGLVPTMTRYSIANATNFGSYTTIKNYFYREDMTEA